uniref:Uncharacterized protein n=1 Tax=Anguilla anguilla TaxID=7936 RepID=A0A0E9SMB7_ANGAN
MKINSLAADYESNITDRDCQTFLTVGQSFTSVTACGISRTHEHCFTLILLKNHFCWLMLV